MSQIQTLNPEAPSFAALACSLLKDGYSIRFRASGYSMTPALCNGDILVFKPSSLHLPRIGDISLHLAEGNRLVAHRIVRITSQHTTPLFHIRGDSPGSPMEIVPSERVLGVATHIEHNGRSVSLDRVRHGFTAIFFSSLRRFAISILRRTKAQHQPPTPAA